MTDGRYSDDVQLLYPCTDEFTQKIKDMDQNINVGDFIDMVRTLVAPQLRALPANATDVQKKAYARNVDHLVAVEVAHSFRELVEKYLNMRNDTKSFQEYQAKMQELENRYANFAGMEDVPLGPEVDLSGRNGLTLLGELIVSMKPIEDIEDLIEQKGASPDALCGKTLPIKLAEQLGRADVVHYLQKMTVFAD